MQRHRFNSRLQDIRESQSLLLELVTLEPTMQARPAPLFVPCFTRLTLSAGLLQDHRVHMPIPGHQLPRRGFPDQRRVPAPPGRALRPVLQGRHPRLLHLRLRAVARAPHHQGRPGARGDPGGHVRLAHRDRPGRAGPRAGALRGPQAREDAVQRRRHPHGRVPRDPDGGRVEGMTCVTI